jgi:hypothetical protein
MSQIGPYKRPVFSWALPGDNGSYTLTIETNYNAWSVGSWTSTPAGFATANANSATVLTFTWTGHQIGYPTFPYLGLFLEQAMNNRSSDDNSYFVRWLFEPQDSFIGNIYTSSSRDADPKLLIYVQDNEGRVSGTMSISQSAPVQTLTPDYETTVDGSWLGIGATNPKVINYASPPPNGEFHFLFDHSPACVWNPYILSYGDSRSKSYSVGTSQNARFHTKEVTEWGERYERELILPLVHAKNMYAYRRHNPLFEEDSIRRGNPNNLYETMTKAQKRDTEFFVWTEMPPQISIDTNAYYSAYKGRVAKIMNNLITDDSGAWGFQGDDQRLYNVALRMIEPLQQKTSLSLGF